MDEDLSRKYPEDTLIQVVYPPFSKAFVALAAGQLQEAVADAAPAKLYDSLYPASYLQGLAYLQVHDGGNAVGRRAGIFLISRGAIGPGAGVCDGWRQGKCQEGV